MTAASTTSTATVLALHHGYRVRGGEEAASEALASVAECELGERVSWLRRDSTQLGASGAARGLLRGGTSPTEITAALQESGADLLHAHNLFPTFGPRALEAAAASGAATVLHLHNSRMVCAVAVNVREGRPCEECSGRWPVPGVVHRCRGSLPEAVAYGAALPRWRRASLAAADAVIVPSASLRDRLHAMGMALPAGRTHIVGGVAPQIAERSHAPTGRYALAVGRLAAEKDLETAIVATDALGLPLVIAGSGPEHDHLVRLASLTGGAPVDPGVVLRPEVLAQLAERPVAAGHVVFTGHVSPAALAALRRGACVALTPSLAPETFGLAALESMAAAVPTIGTDVGALPELLGASAVVPPGDVAALTATIELLAGSEAAGLAAASRAREVGSPAAVGRKLAAAYAQARSLRDARLNRP